MSRHGSHASPNAPVARSDRWLTDRQLLIRGQDRVTAVPLTRRAQIAAVSVAAVAASWLLVSTIGLAWSWHEAAAASSAATRLRTADEDAQLKMARILSENAVLVAQRDQAVARADQLRDAAVAAVERAEDQAVARADLTRDEALARATLIAAANREALAELEARTQASIGQVDAIIRSTGLSPNRFPAGPPAGGHSAPSDDAEDDDLLLDDLGRLDTLGGVLRQMPLAAPVSDISVTSPFGYRPDPWTGVREFHVGVDLRGKVGTPVYATAPGVVSFAGVATGYGNLVTIEHGYGLQTRYSHLEKILVTAGTPVELHQEIGLLGNTGWSTGPHLLYETRVDGQPRDPLSFIKVSGADVQN